jgi:hypothetical protein
LLNCHFKLLGKKMYEKYYYRQIFLSNYRLFINVFEIPGKDA